MKTYNFNDPMGFLGINNNPTGSLGIDINPILEARTKQAEEEEKNRKRAESFSKLRNFAESLQAMNAGQSGNFGAQAQFLNNIDSRRTKEQARLKAEQAKRDEEKLINSMNPEQQRIYKTFGANAAFQYGQQQRNAEIAGMAEQRQIQSLVNLGYTPEQANAIVVGGLKADEVQGLNQPIGQSLEDIRNKVNIERSTVDEVTGKAPADDLANLSQAHGSNFPGGDAFQENVINRAGRFIGTEPADETGAAVRGKKELDERILQITTQNYSGRPSVFLLEQIKGLIPSINTSDKDAAESYSKISNRVEGYLTDLEREINSGEFSGTDLINMQTDYRRLYSLSQDLKTAVGGLYNTKSVSTEPNKNFVSEGKYNNYFINKGNDF